jgi:hypothetical protein
MIFPRLEARFCSSVLSLIVTGFPSIAVYFVGREEDKVKRSVTEIDRVYDRDFNASLSKILDHAYRFIENEDTNKLVSKARFEKFWANADADTDMFLISSRLEAIAQCADAGYCNQEELFSRFPAAVYNAIYFLREFIFLNDDLEKYTPDLEGWWGDSEYEFLADLAELGGRTRPAGR